MKEIKKILCCCGSGLGSSMMVEMNILKALKALGHENVATEHTSLSEASPSRADLIVIGKDLAPQVSAYPRVVILKKIMSVKELTEKLETAFAQTDDTYIIQ